MNKIFSVVSFHPSYVHDIQLGFSHGTLNTTGSNVDGLGVTSLLVSQTA